MSDRTTPPPERRMSEVDAAATQRALLDELNTSPKPKLRERLPRPRLAWAGGAAALAVTILAAIALFPSGGGDGTTSPILERAVAALDKPGVIWHVKSVMTATQNSPDDPRSRDISRMESWFDDNGFRTVYSERSVPGERSDAAEYEIATSAAGTRYYERRDGDQQINASPERLENIPDPFAGAALNSLDPKKMIENLSDGGRAKVLSQGAVTYRGRPAQQVVLEYPVKGERPGTQTFIFSADTYYPLRYKIALDQSSRFGPGEWIDLRYTQFELLPRNRRTEKLLQMSPHPGVRVCKSRKPYPPSSSSAKCPPGTKRGTALYPLLEFPSR